MTNPAHIPNASAKRLPWWAPDNPRERIKELSVTERDLSRLIVQFKVLGGTYADHLYTLKAWQENVRRERVALETPLQAGEAA